MVLRLHDRLKIKGGAVLSPDFVAEGREERGAMLGAPVMVVDNVTRFFYEASGRDDWRTGTNLPPFFPPFEEVFIETRAPRGVFDSRGRPVHSSSEPPPPGVSRSRWAGGVGDAIPEKWGYYLRARDLKRELGEEWDALGSRLTREHLAAEGFPSAWGWRATAKPVRWLLSASYYLEGAAWARRLPSAAGPEAGPMADRPYGPLVRIVLGLDEGGELVRYSGTEDRMRLGRALFPANSEGRQLGQMLAYNALQQFNPMVLAMALMNCRNVTVELEAPSTASAKKIQKRKGHRPTEYYVLDIEPMKEILRSRGQVQKVGLTRAFHLCRGHVRVYTPEGGGPFGRKITEPEVQFVSPHTRGNRSAGEVRKGYEVNNPASEPAFKTTPNGIGGRDKVHMSVDRPAWALRPPAAGDEARSNVRSGEQSSPNPNSNSGGEFAGASPHGDRASGTPNDPPAGGIRALLHKLLGGGSA